MLRTAARQRYCTHRTALKVMLLAAPVAAPLLLLFACRASTHGAVRTSDAAQPAETPPANPKRTPSSKPGRPQPTDHFLHQEAESMAREDQGRAAEALEQEAKNVPPPKPRQSPLRPTRRPVPSGRRP